MFYQDPVGVAALRLRMLAPAYVAPYQQLIGQNAPVTGWLYGEETAIRGASGNPFVDAAVVLVAAAIAVPNLLRSKIAANEASAVGNLRTINVAELTYAANYPERGFARDLATLGPGPGGSKAATADHAAILDVNFVGPTCTEGVSCGTSGYNFLVACEKGTKKRCDEYVAMATPWSDATGTRSFCSTSDGVIRYSVGAPVAAPPGAAQCRAWLPLQ